MRLKPRKTRRSFSRNPSNGLAEEGKVISVRLALFAEMMKGKPWTPATLREVGGTKGVGVTFLEETFSASTAPPEHRFHQKAAQAVLKALLPESGTDIKGQMRSRQDLLEASGYANRPRDFDDLIRILDPELRLITPTDPEGSSSEGQQTTPSGQYYELAHDYLVHSLRDWLTRKQRETRRGQGGTATGGTVGVVECQAREPPSAIRPGMGEHPAADEEEGLDRATAQDDETGGAGAWDSRRPDLGSPGCGSSCRDRRPSPGHRESASHPGCRVWSSDSSMRTPLKSLTSSGDADYRRWVDPAAEE